MDENAIGFLLFAVLFLKFICDSEDYIRQRRLEEAEDMGCYDN